jgi:hypothetical protein
MLAEANTMRIATELMSRAEHRSLAIRDELEDLERRKAALAAEREQCDAMARRLATFQVRSGTVYHCPRCWVEEESQSRMVLKSGGGWGDFLVCELCALEVNLAEA